MKKIIITLFVITSFFSLPVFAGVKAERSNVNAKWNAITLYNNTNTDIAYLISGSYGGAVYGIKRGGNDIYHSGMGDEFASIKIGVCNGGVNRDQCPSFGPLAVCVDGHYNADYIKSIQINSLSSCTVTCLDGSPTSCKQIG